MHKKKFQKLDDIEKFSINENRKGIEGQKLCKQVRDQRSIEANNMLKCYYIAKYLNPKAFAIPILTALGQADLIAVRIGIVNALGFIFII